MTDVTVEPAECVVSAAGGTSRHALINASEVRYAVRAHHRDVDDWDRITADPLFAFLGRGSVTDYTLTVKPGLAKQAQFVFELIAVENDVAQAIHPFLCTIGKRIEHVPLPVSIQ